MNSNPEPLDLFRKLEYRTLLQSRIFQLCFFEYSITVQFQSLNDFCWQQTSYSMLVLQEINDSLDVCFQSQLHNRHMIPITIEGFIVFDVRRYFSWCFDSDSHVIHNQWLINVVFASKRYWSHLLPNTKSKCWIVTSDASSVTLHIKKMIVHWVDNMVVSPLKKTFCCRWRTFFIAISYIQEEKFTCKAS